MIIRYTLITHKDEKRWRLYDCRGKLMDHWYLTDDKKMIRRYTLTTHKDEKQWRLYDCGGKLMDRLYVTDDKKVHSYHPLRRETVEIVRLRW
ncbi:hypothetical protein J6590_081840 [Homalodisca vitripennis]|nr:hypothetical protein J6590_081840 [Homalodisca vitripennis]